MSTYVLVHGSWHGGWCWRPVAAELRRHGHEVFAPTLSGCAERFHHASERVDLQTHVNDICDLLFFEDLTEVVLVAHSYAGLVAQAVVERCAPRLSAVIYLDAYMLQPGQRGFDLWSEARVEEARKSIAAGDPYRKPLPASMLGIDEPDLAAWVEQRLTPHPLATYDEPMAPETEHSSQVPRCYIHCTEGPIAATFGSVAARLQAQGWTVERLRAPHDAMLTDPIELARALQAAAFGLGAPAGTRPRA